MPNAIFLFGWIVWPLGPLAATAVVVGTVLASRRSAPEPLALPSALGWLIAGVAVVWCVVGGQGHWLFANSDWKVRDAVLLDLARDPWPVRYAIDGVSTVLRAPLAYFLPAALVGKVAGIAAGEIALAVWTAVGVALTFALMLRDRPAVRVAAIRLAVFVLFSGMDIVPTLFRHNPHTIGYHIEWWAAIFQYSSQTTQLFWVPNHALPGWIAVAWLLGQDPRRTPVGVGMLMIAFAPLWSPLTAIGVAVVVGVAMLRRLLASSPPAALRDLFDPRSLVPAVLCVALVYPFLVSGSEKVASGFNDEVRWVGEDFVVRYVEFVVFEFGVVSMLLLRRGWRDPLLWAAIAVLLALPVYRFGPYNDLAMRTSIAPLSLLAIRLGEWLSAPSSDSRDSDLRIVAVIVLAIGAVTPAMEFARPFVMPRWDMDRTASVIDATRGSHYLAPADRPWLNRFLRASPSSQHDGSLPR